MIKKKFISCSPKICVNFLGEGDLVVFLHGIGGNKTNLNENLIYLSNKYLCVSFILRVLTTFNESRNWEFIIAP